MKTTLLYSLTFALTLGISGVSNGLELLSTPTGPGHSAFAEEDGTKAVKKPKKDKKNKKNAKKAPAAGAPGKETPKAANPAPDQKKKNGKKKGNGKKGKKAKNGKKAKDKDNALIE